MGPKLTGDIKVGIKEAIRELINDDEFLDRMLTKVNEKLVVLEAAVNNNIDAIRKLEIQVENLQQSDKVNNICVYNLPEDENGNTTELFLKLCRDRLMLNITHENIVRCYRVGGKKDQPRPIIVRFGQYYMKENILKNVSKLKGTGIGIMEDLIRSRLILYKKAQEKLNRRSVFTRYGNIIARVNNKIQNIYNILDIDNLISVNVVEELVR